MAAKHSWSPQGLQYLARAGAFVVDEVVYDGRVIDIGGVARPCGEALCTWRAVLKAPAGSALESELITLELTTTVEDGMEPPQVRICGAFPPHPNVDASTGLINTDFLSDKWTPALKMPIIFTCVRVLLGAPNFDDQCFGNSILDHKWKAGAMAFRLRRLVCFQLRRKPRHLRRLRRSLPRQAGVQLLPPRRLGAERRRLARRRHQARLLALRGGRGEGLPAELQQEFARDARPCCASLQRPPRGGLLPLLVRRQRKLPGAAPLRGGRARRGGGGLDRSVRGRGAFARGAIHPALAGDARTRGAARGGALRRRVRGGARRLAAPAPAGGRDPRISPRPIKRRRIPNCGGERAAPSGRDGG